MTQVLTLTTNNHLNNIDYPYENIHLINDKLKLFKQIDNFTDLNNYAKLLFEHYHSNNLISRIGFTEFDDDVLIEFKRFFSYELNKKIKPISQEFVSYDNFETFVQNVIKVDFNFNYTQSKNINIVNRLLKMQELVFNVIETNFSSLYLPDDFIFKYNYKKKIKKIFCFDCYKYKVYFIDLEINKNNSHLSQICIIQMKNYKQDFVLIENHNIYFIDKVNNKLKIISKNNYDKNETIIINIKNNIDNNFIDITKTNNNFKNKFICLISNSLTKVVYYTNKDFMFRVFENNMNLKNHIRELQLFKGKIIENKFILDSIFSNNLLIERYDNCNPNCGENIVYYDMKNNILGYRKISPIIFRTYLELINYGLNPSKLFNQYELISEINFDTNAIIDFDFTNLTDKVIETKPNLTLIIFENDKIHIDIMVANIDLTYSISKYNKKLNVYQYYTNDNKFPLLTFTQIMETLNKSVINQNLIYDKTNHDLLYNFDDLSNVLIDNNVKGIYIPHKLNLNNEQKQNFIKKNTYTYLNNFRNLLYDTCNSIECLKNMTPDKILMLNILKNLKSNEYFDHMIVDSINYLQIITDKIINKQNLTIQYILDKLFGIVQTYNKINIIDIIKGITKLNLKFNKCCIKSKKIVDDNFKDDNLEDIKFDELNDYYSIADEHIINIGLKSNDLIFDIHDNNKLVYEQIICSNVFDKNNYNQDNQYSPKTSTIITINNYDGEINHEIMQLGVKKLSLVEYHIKKNIYKLIKCYKCESRFINKLQLTNSENIVKIIKYNKNDIGVAFDLNKTNTIDFWIMNYPINELEQKFIDDYNNTNKINITKTFVHNYLNAMVDEKINYNKFSIEIGTKFFKSNIDIDVLNCCMNISIDSTNNLIMLNLTEQTKSCSLKINMLGLGSFFSWICGSSNSFSTNKVVPINTINYLGTNSSKSININGEDVFEQFGSKILTKKIRVGLIEDKPQYVWKICGIKNINTIDNKNLIKCIVKLELEKDSQYIIPSDSEHFFNGKNRCDKAKVVGIYNLYQEEKEYSDDTIAISLFTSKYFEYKKNSILYSDFFDTDITHTCSNGIHVFETIEQAINFGFKNDDKNTIIQMNNIIKHVNQVNKRIYNDKIPAEQELEEEFKLIDNIGQENLNQQENPYNEYDKIFNNDFGINKPKPNVQGKIKIVDDKTGNVIFTNEKIKPIHNIVNTCELGLTDIILNDISNKDYMINNSVVNEDIVDKDYMIDNSVVNEDIVDKDYSDTDYLIFKQHIGLKNRKYNSK